MVRKLALAVSLALGTLSVPVHALGLGELSSKSTLNQSFEGEIALLSVNPDELDTVRVKLADQAAFARAGVERPFYLSLLRFEPQITERGKTIIEVTSEFPIREPFLNFLVEVNWPKGRLLREYTVLLDPPTTTKRRPPVVKPAAKQARSAPAAPKVATPAPQPAAQAPVAPVSSVTTSTAAAADGGEYGPVKANDTAWSIAKKLRPRGVSMEQMMMALLDANPQAFINNDINRLRRGRILRVPSVAEIQQLNRTEARAAYRKQQDEWLARRDAKLQSAAQADEAQGQATPVSGEAAEEPDKLRIATARPEGEGEAGAGDDDAVSATPSGLNARLIAARENAETSRQEAETLRSRVDDLQARLQNMQKLLSLKDEQLAQLQDNVVSAEAEAADEPAAELSLPAEELEGAEPAEITQIDPDAVVEQAAQQVDIDPAVATLEPIGEQAPVEVVIEEAPAEVVVEEAAAEVAVEAEAAAADVAEAIDAAVADLVGEVAPPPADYQIEDIAPQIDPDRIVESSGAVEAPAEMAAADLEIPAQIDPDRIVLGVDQVAQPVDAEISVDAGPDGDVAALPGAEMVIGGETATDVMPAAPEPVVAQEPAPVAAEPAPVEPAAPAAAQADSLIPASVASMVEKNIVPIAVGGVTLLGLLGWLFTRGRRKQDEEEDALPSAAAATAAADVADSVAESETQTVDEPILDPEALADLPDSSFLDDFSPSDINALQDETGEVDPVSEADVYIAYGRYQQAQELLRQAMERDPDRLALKHKLLEVHYATRDADAYVALAQEMVDAGQDAVDAEAWARAQDMGRELAPQNALFGVQEGQATWVEGAAGVAAAAGAAVAAGVASEPVDEDSAVEDLEISELTAAYEEEASALNEYDDLEKTSEVAISLDLEDSSELAAQPEPASAPEPASLDNLEPLEFEMPDVEPAAADAAQAEGATGPDTLDLDTMMQEAEAAVDQDNSELSLDSDFGAAELQAQLDELSDLSALDSTLDDTPELAVAEPAPSLGLVAEDSGSVEQGLDEPLSLDLAYDADQNDDALDTLELDDSEPSSEDEVSTKLDLARAYVEMGDDDGARSILKEVVTEGDDGQRGEAEQILQNLG